ncbi:MAG: hypothetical protein OXC46_11360 [Thaumarchaeota archaeon]|nr:hypothetical protein [Nitrososphaerota archaeon]
MIQLEIVDILEAVYNLGKEYTDATIHFDISRVEKINKEYDDLRNELIDMLKSLTEVKA